MLACAARVGWAADDYAFPKLGDGAGKLVTDRPGFSFTTETVAPWHLVLEMGYDFAHQDRRGFDANVHTFPSLLGRVGLTDWLELRAQWGGYAFLHADASGGGSFNENLPLDTAFGLKARLVRRTEGGCPLNVSVIGSVIVPTGGRLVRTENAYPDVRLPWNLPITDALTAYGSLVARAPNTSDGQFFQGGTTVAMSWFFVPSFGAYVEYYGLYPATFGGSTENVISVGPIWKLADDAQIDFRAAAGLDNRTPDFESSLGLSFLF
jgi:hypothetical protein